MSYFPDAETLYNVLLSDNIELFISEYASFNNTVIQNLDTKIAFRYYQQEISLTPPLFSRGANLLHASIYFKSKKIIDFLLGNISIDSKDDWDRSCAHFAAAGGNVEFFSNFQKIFLPDSKNISYVHYAILYNQPNILKWALKKDPGSLANSKYSSSFLCPINLAVHFGYIKCIKPIFKAIRSVNINYFRTRYFNESMIHLLNNSCFEVLAYFIEFGIDISRFQFQNCALIFFASRSKTSIVLSSLLDYGIDPNFTDELGWTPFHAAASERRIECLKTLSRYSANPLILTNKKMTAFLLANTFHFNDFDRDCAKFIRNYVKKYITMKIIQIIIDNLSN